VVCEWRLLAAGFSLWTQEQQDPRQTLTGPVQRAVTVPLTVRWSCRRWPQTAN